MEHGLALGGVVDIVCLPAFPRQPADSPPIMLRNRVELVMFRPLAEHQ